MLPSLLLPVEAKRVVLGWSRMRLKLRACVTLAYRAAGLSGEL